MTTGDTIEGTHLAFFTYTSDVWDAMYADCSAATASIQFEQYILWDDDAGHRFLRLFADKAKAGLMVHLLLDKMGSRRVFFSPLIKEIRDNGGEVRFYNTFKPTHILNPFRTFPRDHCKTMIIDSAIVYVGSACMADHMRHWRDTQVRLTGALVRDVQSDFAQLWSRRGKAMTNIPYDRHRGRLLRYVSTQPRVLPSPIYRELIHEVRCAKQSITLVTPYFMPPWHMRHALHRAVRRGVTVTLMLSENTDVELADCVSHSYFNRLLSHGIRIMLYKNQVLHAKYAMIDGAWATIGSSNMDYLSLIRNREANLIIRHPPTIGILEDQYRADLASCQSIGLDYWKSRSLLFRLAGHMGRVFRRFL
jgi:cardiolipin synthase